MILEFSRRGFWGGGDTQIETFMKIRSVGAKYFHADRQTERWTDMTKLIVAFRNCANAPKNQSMFYKEIIAYS